MIGSTVGVGVFGLPYAFSQSGFVIGLLELLTIGILIIFLQLMFSEIVLQTDGRHRLVGYIRLYLGRKWGKVAVVAMMLAMWGAMTAHVIVAGNFLWLLLSPIFGGPESLYGLMVVAIVGVFVCRGLGFASKIENLLLIGLAFLFSFIVLASAPHIQLGNLLTFHPSKAMIPYGVILFAISSIAIVPEMREILGSKQERRLGHSILIAMSIVILLYVVFVTIVLGVSGVGTTVSAFDGLTSVLGGLGSTVALSLGFLTIVSVFMMVGIQLKDMLKFDQRIKDSWSCILVLGVPTLLYLMGLREVIQLMGFIGTVFFGLLGILLIFSYLRMRTSSTCRKHACVLLPLPLAFAIALLFAAGILTTIITLFL